MFGILPLLDLARKNLLLGSRRAPRRANLDRQSLGHGSLTLEVLEDRVMLTLLGQQLFPSDYPWNQNIASAPVAANSAAVIAHIGSSIGIHPDWGEDSSTNGSAALYGIPYNVVHGDTTTKINVIIDNYPGESDIVPVPIPSGAVIEGDYQNGPNPNGGGYNSGQRGDSHLLVWDEDTDTAYELYGVTRPSDPTLFPNTNGVELAHTDGLWHAAQETVWHMTEDQFRALGDTSADAAGLSILAGLARPDEGLPTSDGGQGAIDHALRFTLPSGDVAPQYIYPASHVVNESSGSTKLPLGARLRLANTPAIDSQIANMGPEAQIIAHAMQQYGLVLADIGSAMYVTGTSASQTASNGIGLTWDMNDVEGLHGLTAGDFQVVNLTPVVTGLSATSGSAGNTIIINGANFSGAAGHLTVFFGTTAATSVTYISDSQISAVVPSGTGMVNVTVQSGVNETDPNNPSDNVNAPIFGYGTSAISAADQFTFSSQTIGPPVVTANQTSKAATAGQTVSADSVVTVSSFDTDVTGAVVSISGNFQSGDAFQFTAQNGITISSNTGGVLTLTGSATPAQYQTALQSITYSSTSTSTLTRTVSYVVKDSNDTGNVNSNTATTTIAVSAPVAISQLYVNGTTWTTFDTYLGSHDYATGTNVYGFTTGQNIPYGSSTLGFALLTGANQVKTLPWSTMNEVDIQFSGALSATPAASSFAITGGTGGAGHAAAAPSVTSVTSLGGNAYQLSLSGNLGFNNFIISVASTGTAFGAAVTDANGAGISGSWTNSSSTFPSGSGLAGSQFNFQIDVLPGDTNQNGQVAANDSAKIAGLLNDKTTGATSASYVPFVDVNANGTIASNDSAVVAANLNFKTSNITNPTNPSGGLVGGSGFTALALGVQESGSSTLLTTGQTSSSASLTAGSSPTTSVSNVSSPNVSPAVTTSVTTSSTGSGGSSGASTSTTSSHGRHSFAATDAAVSDFDLVDLWT